MTAGAARRNGIASYDLAVSRPQEAVPALFGWAAAAGVEVHDLRVEAATFEDVFLARTGSRLRD